VSVPEFRLARRLRPCADDEAARFVRQDEMLQLFPEQRALGLVFDALRDADVGFLRQVDQQPVRRCSPG